MKTLSHYDLRAGTKVEFPLSLHHPLTEAAQRAVLGSSANRGTVGIAGSNVFVAADVSMAHHGVAAYALSSWREGEPTAQIETPLCIGVVAAALPTAPRAWRHILQEYYSAIPAASLLQSFSAPGGMPKTMPWGCAFGTPATRRLNRGDDDQLRAAILLVELFLFEHCRRGWTEAVEAGSQPHPDPNLYPELTDDAT